jgi:hypothetical protein
MHANGPVAREHGLCGGLENPVGDYHGVPFRNSSQKTVMKRNRLSRYEDTGGVGCTPPGLALFGRRLLAFAIQIKDSYGQCVEHPEKAVSGIACDKSHSGSGEG